MCYRKKWIDVTGTPMDWSHYEGQERDENRYSRKVERYYKIEIR